MGEKVAKVLVEATELGALPSEPKQHAVEPIARQAASR